MSALILVVEDDEAILRGVSWNLEAEGFSVCTATDGRAAVTEALEMRPDLILLDIMLPEQSGFQACRILRRKGITVPIVLLSAKNTEHDIVTGLELGADDYVTKPFRFAELLARIRAHLRRQSADESIRFGSVVVERTRRVVRRDGEVVTLSKREFDLLEHLISRQGRPVTREQILKAVWGSQYLGTDRTVDNVITRLRQKLDLPGSPRHIVTVRGIGYRLDLTEREV